jgi:hypothetical protein
MEAMNNNRYELLRLCPSLSDSCVLARSPGILEVSWFIYSTGLAFGAPPLFESLGIETLEEYVRLVDSKRNFRARRSYQLIRENLIGLREEVSGRANQ